MGEGPGWAAIDVHVHVDTGETARVRRSARADAERQFKSTLQGMSIDAVADFYRARRMLAVIFCVDKETATGVAMSNDEIAEAAQRHPDAFLGFASVDPWKGELACAEARRCVDELGLRGFKFQPVSQRFLPNDDRFYPLWETLQELGVPAIFHTGTTGMGTGAPGGRGLKLKYGKPVPHIDDVAADFPALPIIAAHPAWPWYEELLAVVHHKGNVYMDLSGWAPKYLPAATLQYANTLVQDKVLFGSDFPLLDPDRWLGEFADLAVRDHVRPKILRDNAARLLGLVNDDD